MHNHETDKGGRAICRVCGNSYNRINKHVTTNHSMSMAEYETLPAWPGIKAMKGAKVAVGDGVTAIDEGLAESERYISFGVGRVLSFGRTPAGAEDISEEIWNSEGLSYIPDLDETFIPNPSIMEMLALGIQMNIPVYSYGPTGCHAAGTPILLANGSTKVVEKITQGDRIMGPDGSARTVHTLYSGTEEMYEITPIKGDSFVVNKSHVLSLVNTTTDEVVNITVEDYLNKSNTFRHLHKLYRSSLLDSFENNEENLPVDPYFVGILLGDGCLTSNSVTISNSDAEIIEECYTQASIWDLSVTIFDKEDSNSRSINLYDSKGILKGREHNPLLNELKNLGLRHVTAENKFVPEIYKFSDSKSRFEILAGLMDSDGSYDGGFDYISKSKTLSEDVTFIARSLGLAAYVTECQKSWQNGTGIYYRVSISGHLELIPTRVARKQASVRRQAKNVLRTGFSIKSVGIGEYYGFGVDKDNLYLLGDFTVTHNSGKTSHVWHLAAMTRTPVRRVNLHGDTRASDLMGTREVVTDDDGNSITKFNPGIVTQCMINGWWLLLDEMDCAKTGIVMVLQSILERAQGKKQIYVPNYGMVDVHPLFRIFGTGNTNGRGEFMELYPGTQILNEAFMDRFALATYVPYNWNVIREALPKRVPGCGAFIDTMLKVAKEIQSAFESEECYFTLSPRKVFTWAEVTKLYEPGYGANALHKAAAAVIFSKLGNDDRAFFSEVYQRLTGFSLMTNEAR